MSDKFYLGSYGSFLYSFLDKGYSFKSFTEYGQPKGEIILRHDVDLDVELAYKCAQEEHCLGIKSSYFFLLRSSFYHIFSTTTRNTINKIKDLGHNIGIHFDPTIYDDFHRGLEEEVALFKFLFETEVEIISLHRPNDFFQNFNSEISGIQHTYQNKFFKELKYFADSRGLWRYGHPCDSEEFNNFESMQIVIHPIWWFIPGENNTDVLRKFYRSKMDAMKSSFIENSIPFREIAHEF